MTTVFMTGINYTSKILNFLYSYLPCKIARSVYNRIELGPNLPGSASPGFLPDIIRCLLISHKNRTIGTHPC